MISPAKPRINELYTTLYKKFGQYLYTEFKKVEIETDKNIFGFDFFAKIEKDNFIIYDKLEIIPQPGYDLDDENNKYPIIEIEIQLNDKVLLETRKYFQFIDVLSEVGGFMEL